MCLPFPLIFISSSASVRSVVFLYFFLFFFIFFFKILNDRYRVNQEPWYLGGMPGKPGINAFIDDFKVHGEALEEGAIQAECQGALGNTKHFLFFFFRLWPNVL